MAQILRKTSLELTTEDKGSSIGGSRHASRQKRESSYTDKNDIFRFYVEIKRLALQES